MSAEVRKEEGNQLGGYHISQDRELQRLELSQWWWVHLGNRR